MFTIWLTGLPSSGKSTLARELKLFLTRMEFNVFILDGDEIRNGLCKDLGFTLEDREENIRRIRYMCKVLNRFKIVTIVAAITPYEKMREQNRKEIENFIEIFVDAPLDECIKRDVKGLYKKAINGKIKNFTGISDEFEIPKNPTRIIDTKNNDVKTCLDKVIWSIPYLSNLSFR